MGRMPLTRSRHGIHRGNAHTPHQGRDLPPPTGMALLPEESTRHAGAGKRILQMPLVNPTHQRRCHVRNWLRLIVRGGPSQLQQLALSRNWYRVGSIDHRVVFSKPALVSAPSTKSFSTVSWPIRI